MRRSLFALQVVFGIASLLSPAAFAEVDQVEQGIAGGSLDEVHRAVFATVAHLGDYGALCTATLIAPNLMLTARHCVSEGGSETVICGVSEFTTTIAGSSFYATNDAVPNDASKWYQGRDVRVPSEGADACGFDVALVVLNSNVPSSVAKPAIPRIDQEVQQGELYVAVGYGQDETGESAGGRMVLGNLEVQCGPGTCGVYGVESTEFLGDTGICSGDSGGPALDMDGKVVGVVSRGADGCDSPIYGTVTAWRDWLMENALQAATLGDYDPPYWAVSGTSSEPPVAGSDGGAPATTGGQDGSPCAAPADCASGFACYYDSSPSDAVCRPSCATSADCSGSSECRMVGANAGVCLQAQGSADESCAVAAPGRSFSPSWLWIGLGALLPLAARRRGRGRRA